MTYTKPVNLHRVFKDSVTTKTADRLPVGMNL